MKRPQRRTKTRAAGNRRRGVENSVSKYASRGCGQMEGHYSLVFDEQLVLETLLLQTFHRR